MAVVVATVEEEVAVLSVALAVPTDPKTVTVVCRILILSRLSGWGRHLANIQVGLNYYCITQPHIKDICNNSNFTIFLASMGSSSPSGTPKHLRNLT